MLNTLRICTPSTCCPQDLLCIIRLGVFAAVLWSPEDERQDASLRETNSIFVWDLMTESGESESSTPRPSLQKKQTKKNACLCDFSATNQTHPMVLYAVVLLTINWTNPKSNVWPLGSMHSWSESTWESRNVYLLFSECVVLCLLYFSLSVIFHFLSCVTLLMQIVSIRRNRFNNRSRLILIFTNRSKRMKTECAFVKWVCTRGCACAFVCDFHMLSF